LHVDATPTPATGAVRMGDASQPFTIPLPGAIKRVRVRIGISAAARAGGRAEPIEVVMRQLTGRICPK
jgi:hypothetical protein